MRQSLRFEEGLQESSMIVQKVPYWSHTYLTDHKEKQVLPPTAHPVTLLEITFV
jgi:hypothetical protein